MTKNVLHFFVIKFGSMPHLHTRPQKLCYIGFSPLCLPNISYHLRCSNRKMFSKLYFKKLILLLSWHRGKPWKSCNLEDSWTFIPKKENQLGCQPSKWKLERCWELIRYYFRIKRKLFYKIFFIGRHACFDVHLECIVPIKRIALSIRSEFPIMKGDSRKAERRRPGI